MSVWWRQGWLVLGLLLSLNSCGFHLRGSLGFQLSLVHIESEAADQVAAAVKHTLGAEGVKIVPIPNAAQAILQLRHETLNRRILSVSAISGKLREIELDYRVEMTVHKPTGEVLLKPSVIELSRDYSFDETAVLAMATEEQVLREELFRSVVEQVIRRLQALKLGAIPLTSIQFVGLKSHYAPGEAVEAELIATTPRVSAVDIWLTVSNANHVWFVNSEQQLTSTPQAWRQDVPVQQQRHRLKNILLPSELGGQYTIRALYNQVDTQLDFNNMAKTMRSNLAEGHIVITE